MEIVLLIIVILVIIFFIYCPLKPSAIDENTSNIKINQQKIKELKEDLVKNLITPKNFEISRVEIEKNLANELINNTQKLDKKNIPNYALVIFLISFISIASYIIYTKVRSVNLITNLTTNGVVVKDGKYWHNIGSTYNLKGQLDKAKDAYQQAYKLGNKSIALLTEYASILAKLNNNMFNGKPAELVREALEKDSNSVEALYLAGVIAANNNAFDLAKNLWEKALSFSIAGDENYQLLTTTLQQLSDFINQQNQSNNAISINVIVDINEQIYKKHFDSYIMIYAKAVKGRPMPIAIKKIKMRDFIGMTTLSDKDSIMPTNKLSNNNEIIIIARISNTGNAVKQNDDIDIKSIVLKVEAQNILLTIK